MTRAERDAEIARQFAAGRPRSAIAAAFGMTPRRVSQIAREQGARRSGVIVADKGGRPVEPATHDPHYRKLRRLMGAAWAREAMGMAA